LNHPNILTIYEIGETAGSHFIATEFVEGETLRQRITEPRGQTSTDGRSVADARMKLDEALDIGAQVASALSAAHEAGIVHRDIKPENIMLRADGLVKVLDFGLAKLTERAALTANTEAATRPMVETIPGMVLGTAAYMSPEQARGLALDARTDIWSLGVVLYEMLTGHAPFEGETATDVILSVVEREPPALASYSEEVPAELERIVSKALHKNREERHLTVKDLALDLKSLKQELEKSGVPVPGEWSSDAKTAPPEGGTLNTRPSSAEYIVSEIKSHKPGVLLVLVTLVIAVAAVVYFFYFAKAGEAIDSVAVIPFVNVSGDPDTEYLSDGLSDSIINSLSQLPNLKVMSLSSTLRYKGKQTDPQMVRRELNVRAVLMGRLIQRGDNLLISAELVDARDNRRLWGEQYNRKLSDILQVQGEISREISEKLRLQLTGEERKQLAKRYTENTEAYQAYLQGRYYFRRYTGEGLKKSIEYFEQAIKIDPAYAPAYVGLARAYRDNSSPLPPKESRQKVEQALVKALGIDDTLAEAHTLLGSIRQDDDDWGAAEREFKRGIELNPSSTETRRYYSDYLQAIGRNDEAMAEAKRALELEPLSPGLNSLVGQRFYDVGQYDRAIEQYRRALEIDPNRAPVRARLGLAYLQKGMYEEAIVELKKARDLDNSPERPYRFAVLAYAYAASGKRAEAQKMLDELKELAKQRDIAPINFAIIYAGLGDKDQAFAWLDKAYKDRSGPPYLKIDFVFDSLRSDPRFAAFARRKGLAP
jgi:serine/threonine-protein kinase